MYDIIKHCVDSTVFFTIEHSGKHCGFYRVYRYCDVLSTVLLEVSSVNKRCQENKVERSLFELMLATTREPREKYRVETVLSSTKLKIPNTQ